MNGIKVLLIEDELKIADFVTKGLMAAGAQVTHVTDGATGLKVALEDSHDILVLDIMLPAMNGLDVMRELRQSGNSKSMIFSFEQIIAYLSQFITLKIGDIIFTGTPAGVGKVEPEDLLNGYIENKKMFSVTIK